MKEKEAFVRHFRDVQPKFARLCLKGLCRSGLTMPQYALLNLLSQGSVPMGDLSTRLHVTKPAVTNLVDRLETSGFLRRADQKNDRRVKLIEISPKGKKLVRDMQSTILGFLLRTLGDFSSNERSVITRFYEMLSKNLDANLQENKAAAKSKVIKKVMIAAFLFFLGTSVAVSFASAPVEKLSFESYMQIALSRSETIKQAREDIKIARARTLQAIGEAIGGGDFVITHNFQEEQGAPGTGGSNVSNTFNSPHRRERKFMFSQPLFQGFKSVGALLGAGDLKGQRKSELDYAKERLFVEAAEAYYALLSAEKDLDILSQSQQVYQERIKDLEEREKIGRSRSGEVALARSKTKILEARIAGARSTLLSAQSWVGFYTGIAHAQVEDDDPETFSEMAEIDPENYAAIVEKRADVSAARNAMRVAKQTIVVKQSAIWPKISLDANHYEKREGFQDGITWDAMVVMDVPLYRGGENIGQVLEARSNYRKAQLQYELIKKQALLEVEQAHQNWIAAREQHRAYVAAVEAAQANYDFQKQDYGHNLVSNLDVMTALEELLTIREDANSALYAMKINYWKLQMAANQGVPEWAEAEQRTKNEEQGNRNT